MPQGRETERFELHLEPSVARQLRAFSGEGDMSAAVSRLVSDTVGKPDTAPTLADAIRIFESGEGATERRVISRSDGGTEIMVGVPASGTAEAQIHRFLVTSRDGLATVFRITDTQEIFLSGHPHLSRDQLVICALAALDEQPPELFDVAAVMS